MKKNWIVLAAMLLALVLGVMTSQRVMAQETAEEEAESKEGIDLQELREEVSALFRDGDMEGGIELLEEAIKKEPKNYELLMGASQFYAQYGVDMAEDDRKAANQPLMRSVALMREVQANKEELNREEQGWLALCVYNEACCAAVDEKADDAFKLLAEAIELGFQDLAQIKGDSDFDSIRDDDRFDKILAELEDKDETDRASRRPSEDA